MGKVQVKLAARCLVDKQEREAGEIVEIDATIARHFGEVVTSGDTKPSAEPLPRPLKKSMPKAALIAEANRLGVLTIPEDASTQHIIDLITAVEHAEK